MRHDTPTNPQISTEKTMTVKERLAAAKTSYLSIPAYMPQSIKDGLLKRVRKRFPHLRTGSFATEFEDQHDWQKHIKSFLADVDVLIVAVDSTRRAGLGVGREIEQMRRAGKLIFLFDVLSGRWSRFFGFDIEKGEDGRRTAIKLREDPRPRAYITQEKVYDDNSPNTKPDSDPNKGKTKSGGQWLERPLPRTQR